MMMAAPAATAEPFNLGGLTRDRVLEIAKGKFGWASGLGGFDDAVIDFAVQLECESKSSAPAATAELTDEQIDTIWLEIQRDWASGWKSTDSNRHIMYARAILAAQAAQKGAQ